MILSIAVFNVLSPPSLNESALNLWSAIRVLCFLLVFSIGGMLSLLNAQCTGAINTFPFHEDFEMNDGSWIPGGTGSDWAWGNPDKPVITGAGSGNKCWVTGG